MAVRMGRLDVDQMLRELTARQLLEWRAYDTIEPLGDDREDLRAASIREMVFNMAVAGKDRRPLNDFLLEWEPEDPEEAEKRKQKELEARVAMHRRLIPLIAMAFAEQNVKEI